MEETISSYKDFYLVYSKFDLETYIQKEKQKNPQRSEKYIKNMYLLKSVRLNLLDSEFERLLEEYEKSYSKKLFLYYGTCNYCEIQNAGSCTYDDGEPCRFPEERRYSMEAVGIEVIKTVRNIDIDIGYPSQKFSFKFGLACFK
jgi:predicted metal-binding protein